MLHKHLPHLVLALAILVSFSYAQVPVIDCQFDGNLTNDGSGQDPVVDIGQITYADGAAFFDGETGLEVPGSREYADADFTIDMRIYFDREGLDQQQYLIGNYYKAGENDEVEPTVYLRYQGDKGVDDGNDHKFKFYMRQTHIMRELELFHEDAVEMEVWYRLTVRKSGQLVEFWVNGELASSYELDLNPTNEYQMLIGKQVNDGNPNRLDGRLDYMRMWTVAVDDDSLALSVDDNRANPIVNSFHLSSVYPNPFNSMTTVRYTVDKPSYLIMTVYDISGRSVATLVDKLQMAGDYSFVWDASGMQTGVYLLSLSNERFAHTRKIILIK